MIIQPVDFSSDREDLKARGVQRLLTQFQNSPVLVGILLALINEIQTLHDAIIDVMQSRTLSEAGGETLTILGKLVGVDRTGFVMMPLPILTESALDILAEDNNIVAAASFAEDLDDPDMLKKILIKIHANFNTSGSIPEITQAIRDIFNIPAKIVVIGPMSLRVDVPVGTENFVTGLLTYKLKETNSTNEYLFPYPAGTDVTIGYY